MSELHSKVLVDGLDVEAVLEFAEYVVLNSRRLWEEFPLDLRRRMQKVLFPEGLVYDGKAFRTPVTCLFFRDLERPESELKKVVARTGFEHGGAGVGMQCTDPGQAVSETGVRDGGELVALRDRLSNPLIVELTAFGSLRTAVG